jgi:hypothetical protein
MAVHDRSWFLASRTMISTSVVPTSVPVSPSSSKPSRLPSRPASKKDRTESRAAYLVLLMRGGLVKALLFNADHHYLAEVIDDPLTVDQLCSAGQLCEAPAGVLAAQVLTLSEDDELFCFALGRH